MRTINILVEGIDDIIFLRRLIEVMRQQKGLTGELNWTLLGTKRTETVAGIKFGHCAVRLPSGSVVALMDTIGVYGSGNPPTFNNPALMQVKLTSGVFPVTDIVGVFDADAPTNFLGNVVPYGGFAARTKYINSMLSRQHVGYKYFLFPDNCSDGTMETLVSRFVLPQLSFELRQNWPAFRSQLKADLNSKGISSLPYSEKCTLSQFSTVHDPESAKDLYWLASLWNGSMWDWNAKSLEPLKNFIQAAIPELFSNSHAPLATNH